jgi:hypothetical protein
LLHRDLAPDLQANEETKRMRDPTAFWCVRYQAIPMQVGCIFFLIEIFPPCIQLRCTFFFRIEISSVP